VKSIKHLKGDASIKVLESVVYTEGDKTDCNNY
jgi:hypothetical protein